MGRLAYRLAYLALRVWSAVLRPHTRGVKCVVSDGPDVLLVRHSYGPALWDLPGGFCRPRESFAGAVRRELGEELGLPDGAEVVDLGEVRRRMHGRHETLRIFRVRVSREDVAVQSAEIAAAAWFARGAIPVARSAFVDNVIAADSAFAHRGGG